MEEPTRLVEEATINNMDRQQNEEERDPESNSLHQPLLKRNRTLSSSPFALVGAKVSHIESLDYEINENDLFKHDWRRRSRVQVLQYVFLKWTLAFLVGLLTGVTASLINLAIENIAGYKLRAVVNYIEDRRYLVGFAYFAGANFVLTLIAALLCVCFAPTAAGPGIPEIKAYLNGVDTPNMYGATTLFVKIIGSIAAVSASLDLGKEGPLVHIGACFASLLGQGGPDNYRLKWRWLRYFNNDRDRRDLITCGSSSGVCAAFRSPVGGVLFALEEVATWWRSALLWRTFFSTAVVVVILRAFIEYCKSGYCGLFGRGGLIMFDVSGVSVSYHVVDIIPVVVIGIIGGLLGSLYNCVLHKVLRLYNLINEKGKLHKVLLALSVSLFTSICMYGLPFLAKCKPCDSSLQGSCPGTGGTGNFKQFNCPDGYYNDLATLLLTTNDDAVRNIFSINTPGEFHVTSLIIYFVLYCILGLITFGIAVPSGLFLPIILMGSAYGRLLAIAMGSYTKIDPGLYAVLGAASLMAGSMRMTVSLCVIFLELTNNLLLLPITMLVLLIAKSVGDCFNLSIYEIILELKGLPFLDANPEPWMRNITAGELADVKPPVVTLCGVEKVGRIVEAAHSQRLSAPKMSIGARELTVLGEFKPFGLIAEALDGSPSDNCAEDYRYFLFSPELTKQRDEADELDLPSPSSDRSDHELFIRGNRIIWSIGSRVYKRFTSPSTVIKACWCRMGYTSEAVLCILQSDSLTIYNTSGEVTSVPLSRNITSIWPLPYGLLLQQAPEGSSPAHIPFSSLSPFLSARDTFRSKRDVNPQNCTAVHGLDFTVRGDGSSMSSLQILKDPLEEPQPTYIEERGKLNFIKEFDERTIWTGDCVPLMASYNKAKLQHSLWVVEKINSNIEMGNSRFPDVPVGVLTKQFSFRRIWQGKGSQTAASKVFLATDDDTSPIICFLLQEQKKLLSLRLQTVEINTETIYDIKPDMSWSILAVAAAPVVVTRPGVKVGGLPFVDIVVLTSENTLLLYSGKQCLCRFKLSSLGKDQILHDPKIVGLADAVEERINVIVNSGRIYRCTWRRNPSSSLANDCITALAEGMSSTLYNHFLVLLWRNGDQAYLSRTDLTADSEWESFQSVISQICKESSHNSEKLSDSVSCSSWEFLINSRYHKQYSKSYPISGFSETSIDQQGSYSPGSFVDTSHNAESSLYAELLAETLDTLHTVYESLKLNNLRKRDLGLLVVLLCDIAAFLHEDCYLDHYIRDFPCLSKGREVSLTSSPKKIPPSLFRWLESCLKHGCSSASISHLPSLIFKDGSSVVNWGRKIVSFYSLLCGAELLGKRLSSGVSCAVASGSFNTPEELTILAMVGERVGLQQLDLLPAGVSLPLRDALDKCRESPPMDWPAAAYVLLGREDLAFSRLAYSRKSVELEPHINVNMTCMSTPYMLNLHPVTIPSSISDTIESDDNKLEDVDSVEGSVADGMEHIFNSGIQLRYGRDLRLNEVRRLLCSARPVVIQTPVNPTASDQDLQQAQLWQLAQRTTALPFGRGAFTLATTCTLLTEALTVPKLVLAGRLPAQQNATVNLDPNVRNVQEFKSWPEFHNAVAAGLRLAPPQGKMSRTWILYNKPEEPNVVHAGLLLALGLHGHLRVLTITDIYQYYSQEHESTTVGLMLGLAASYRGTMQPAISKSLYVHIPSHHPSSFPELELPTLLQAAALLSVGLLYEGSAHPQTMQILLGEIGRRSGGDNVLEREGYAVAAGFSLGLVALGRGEDALGFVDALVDRLFQYIGCKEPQNERFHLFAPSIDEHNRSAGQIMDSAAVNVDVTAPGATIALALMFLKTESELVYSRLSVPQTHFDLHYVRPDFIMLRVIARNLIMWSRVHASEGWIHSQIPEVIQNGVKDLGDSMSDTDEIHADAFVQAYVHIMVGACISLGLRYAGTRDDNLQELLYKYALYFLNEIKPVSVTTGRGLPKGLSRYIDRGSLETCLHLIVLSLCVVMAGSGHLQTFKLLKYLRGRNSADGHLSFGNQMAVSLATGFLFLGGGMQTFSTSKSSIAALLITLYPRLPTGPNDNRCHLQAFRHLYVLAAEARWVQTVDVDTGLPVYCPLEVTVRETEHYAETSFYEVTPCILPERAVLKAVHVCGPRYWPQVINHIPEEKSWSSGDKNDALSSGVLYVKRKVGACSYVDDPAGCQSLLSRAMHKVFGLTRLRASATSRDCRDGDMVDQLISTFSSNPSLISFAQLCCDPNWNSRSDIDFQEFCLQVLFECVSKDRAALLQVYLSLYTTIGSMVDQITSRSSNLQDTLFISSLKIALAYSNGLLSKRSTSSKEGIVQSTFLGSVQKRVDEILNSSLEFPKDFSTYMKSGKWPTEDSERRVSSTLLSWYVRWYNVASPFEVKRALDKIKAINTSSSVPLLHLVFPTTDVTALSEIAGFCSR